MSGRSTSAPVLTLLAQILEKHTGIHHGEKDFDLLAAKVNARASELGFESLLDYYYLLQYSDPAQAELTQLVDAVVVGETFFFRDPAPLEGLVAQLPRVPLGAARTRIWSAACATGEEAITLAILLERAGLSNTVDIVATDVSARAIDRARRGEYGARAHRTLPDGLAPWIGLSNGRAVVDAGIRAAIDWRQVNLLDDASVASLGTFDAIVCRNVLIYFSHATVRKVALTLASALRPQGRVLLGSSESLMRFDTALEVEERRGCFFYKRTAR